MNTSLYELSGQYVQVFNALADSEMDELTISDTLEGLEGEISDKCINMAAFIRNLCASSESIKQAESAMADRRKAIEKKADRIESYLLANMIKVGVLKVESPYFVVSVKNNPPSVVLDDVAILPADYWRYPVAPDPSPDKTLIAKAIKDGYAVPGCSLVSKQSLSIK